VIFWGTFFPLISEAVTGDKASVGPPWFDRLATPLALVLVLLSGIGPVVAWRRITPRNLRRALVAPLAFTGLVVVGLLLVTDASESVPSLLMFCFVAFVLAVVAQEFWRGARARRVMTGEQLPRALVRLAGRNRRRYGGYLVHAGIAVLFIGVAASSVFIQQRDVRLRPGQSARSGDYTLTYDRPTADLGADRAGTGAPISIGAVVTVRKGDQVHEMRPARNFYPARDASQGPIGPISQFFEGEANSEVDLRWGARRDEWLAIRPDVSSLVPIARKLDTRLRGADTDTQARAVAALTEIYRRDPPPASFRFIVSPLVAWIWIGGAIARVARVSLLGVKYRRTSRVTRYRHQGATFDPMSP
jgi:cytochrome c-type biogenesis protein CcmF